MRTERFEKRRALSGGEGYERLNRDPSGVTLVRVHPGGYYLTDNPYETLVTVLGTCVSACIRDTFTGIGGMNHFLLPEGTQEHRNVTSAAMRYGNHAMEVLINELLDAGCPRKRLEVKVFGGASLKARSKTLCEIGTGNAAFILEYLAREGMPVAAQDLGGDTARRLQYTPSTGKARMRLLAAPETTGVLDEETRFEQSLHKQRALGDVELF